MHSKINDSEKKMMQFTHFDNLRSTKALLTLQILVMPMQKEWLTYKTSKNIYNL